VNLYSYFDAFGAAWSRKFDRALREGVHR
jgi:hypothetical protein